MADASYWDHRALTRAPSAHRLRLGERSALFCARRQQLYDLNPTADAIWLALAEHGTPAAAGAAVGSVEFVRQAADAWLRGGQLVPAEAPAAEPHAELDLAIDELRLTLRLCGEAAASPVRAVFGQFAADEGGRPLSAVGLGGLVFLLDGEQPLGAWDERSWIPELKAQITDLYTKSVSGGFLAHAALLSRGARGLLVCGQPGDGKTTLSAALGANGFDYRADDIVRIDPAGRAFGVPFAPAAKSGAWPLLRRFVPEIDGLPAYMRSDGQEVRYLPVPATNRDAVDIAAVLILDRGPEGEASVTAVEPMEALTTILASAWSSRRSIEAETLKALARTVERARCGRLTYARLEDALHAIEAFLA